MSKQFYMPTRIVFGTDCVQENSSLLKVIGKKAFIVTGVSSSKNNGSLDDVLKALETESIEYELYDKVLNNPNIQNVYEGADIARTCGADFIIAIGGGSPMDAAKAISVVAAQSISQKSLFLSNYYKNTLPVVAIPTTSGTGAEATQYAILTNIREQTKTAMASDVLFPVLAFLDASYTATLGLTTTINTAMDALSHAVEGMLSVRATFISDALAEESIRLIMSCAPFLIEAKDRSSLHPLSEEVREKLLYASFLAGTVIAQTATTAVHAMGYSLTYFKGIDHGRANGLLLGSFMNILKKEAPQRVQKICSVMNMPDVSFFLMMVDKLLGEKELVTPEEIAQFSQKAIKTKHILNGIVKLKEEDIIEIYSSVFNG